MGFSIDEWESLPWWQQRVYIEGLIRDEHLAFAEGAPDGEEVAMAEHRVAAKPNTAPLDDFSALGLTATTAFVDGDPSADAE